MTTTLREHFEELAHTLEDCARLHESGQGGDLRLSLVPRRPGAATVVLHLPDRGPARVGIQDQACAPVPLEPSRPGAVADLERVVDDAVHGRLTVHHLGRGGCVERGGAGTGNRTWHRARPWPGWRRRADRVVYNPYR